MADFDSETTECDDCKDIGICFTHKNTKNLDPGVVCICGGDYRVSCLCENCDVLICTNCKCEYDEDKVIKNFWPYVNCGCAPLDIGGNNVNMFSFEFDRWWKRLGHIYYPFDY